MNAPEFSLYSLEYRIIADLQLIFSFCPFSSDTHIINQKKMLEDYAKSNGYTDLVHFTDDGYSGGNFDRPGWKEMLGRLRTEALAQSL